MKIHNEHCTIIHSDQFNVFIELSNKQMIALPKPCIDVYYSDRTDTRHLITMPQWLAIEQGLTQDN